MFDVLKLNYYKELYAELKMVGWLYEVLWGKIS